jgi:deoxyadenosine/deoxycytidine kinase
MKRIEICGNIATGKTTLAIQFNGESYSQIFENFQNNPFYKAFYQNPQAFSFETEVTFLLQHYHAIKIHPQNKLLICDYSLLQDMAYADVNLTGNRHRIFFEVVEEIQYELGPVQNIIYLKCPEKILLERIIARSREAETSIPIDYLRALSEALDNRVSSISSLTNVITINSDLVDFRTGVDSVPELAQL